MTHPSSPDHDDRHHLGLQADLGHLLGRRRALRLLGGGALLAVVGCSGDDAGRATETASTTTGAGDPAGSTASTAAGSCDPIPEETAGPFPGDGSNGPNVLDDSGIVRSDIRSSIGEATGTAEGLDLSVRLTVLDSSTCEPLAGAAVYLWHCDRDGRYSIYEVEDQNYLRGVQETAADGTVTFRTIFPGCYAGRWPHIHFEVYPSVASTSASGNTIATSQLALPPDTCETVYATGGYETSARNLPRVSLESDGIFRDGYTTQLATIGGSPAGGLTADLVVPV